MKGADSTRRPDARSTWWTAQSAAIRRLTKGEGGFAKETILTLARSKVEYNKANDYGGQSFSSCLVLCYIQLLLCYIQLLLLCYVQFALLYSTLDRACPLLTFASSVPTCKGGKGKLLGSVTVGLLKRRAERVDVFIKSQTRVEMI